MHDSLDTNIQGFHLFPDDVLRHTPTQVLHQKPYAAVFRESEGVKTHTLSPSGDRRALFVILNTSAIDGRIIIFYLYSWAVRPPGQNAPKQGRKVRSSRTPVIKIGVLLTRSPTGKQVLVYWACGVVPSGLQIIGPDMSLHMGLFAVSDEKAV
jgi:hypothetical protein